MILHIDCNSFYASCEVSLRPELKGKPVVVANYNEAGGGIILALTKEAKALGLKRGNPVFQVRDVLEKNGVVVFPANLQKYVDISKRIMQVVQEQEMVQAFHRYSVDEFFAEIPEMNKQEAIDYVATLKEAIEHGTGIPVSCGISVTYTLAKVATWYAKRFAGYKDICVLQPADIEKALRGVPIADVWGVGYRSAPKMGRMGIKTAWDYSQKPQAFIQKSFRLPGVRTWMELRGQQAVDITTPPKQQSIMHSRTFTYMTDSRETLAAYIANYTVAAARKLRDQHSVCRSVTVFVNTNRHRLDLPQYSNTATVRLANATAGTTELVNAAQQAFDGVFREHYQYKRAGVVLSEIADDSAVEQDLFVSTRDVERQRRLMEATDSINTRYGMDKVRLAAQEYRHENREPADQIRFEPLRNETTNIDDIITVR